MPDPRAVLLAILLLILVQAPPAAHAHESRPAYLSLHEQTPGTFRVQWKTPVGGLLRAAPAPEFPAGCSATPGREHALRGARVTALALHCAGGLAGRTVGVRGLVENVGLSAYVQIAMLDGSRAAGVLTSTAPSITVPERASLVPTVRAYARLGVMHIASGVDHLLFIAGLVILVRGRRELMVAITGFTLAHSLTLALSVFELVRLPATLVETCIALSIVFLAADIARGSRDSLAFRYPVAVAGAFGLVHGFGFAGALLELGMPQLHYAAALLAFNAGVEIGQVVVILTLLLLAWTAGRAAAMIRADGALLPGLLPRLLQRTALPAAGCTAAYWVLLRLDQMFTVAA